MTSQPALSAQFSDVKAIMDQALAAGGGTFVCASRAKATAFRHRCYTFRKKWREVVAPSASPYDLLTIPRTETEKVEFRAVRAQGTFIPEGGAPLGAAAEVDDFEAEALALAMKLDLE